MIKKTLQTGTRSQIKKPYPVKKTAPFKESKGTIIANKTRSQMNFFSDDKRQALLERGLAMIYGGEKGKQQINRP